MGKNLGVNGQDFNQEIVDTESVKCSSCGSNMVFHPESQMLICLHCGTKQSFKTDTVAEERSLIEGLKSADSWSKEEAVVFHCENCGAKVVLQKSETASSCPFCGTAHVKKTDELAGVKPNAVVPFSFDGDKAISLSKAWAKKRFFAPRSFKKNLSAESVKGTYVPTFTFDSFTTSYYHGRIGITRTRTVGSGKNRRVQTYVVWRNISGTFNLGFDDLLISAGTKFNQSELNKISPFDTNSGKQYQENYLLGFMAYHYDVELTECWAQARKIIDDRIRSSILRGYHYDRVAFLNVSTSHQNVTFKYVMLPVYVGSFSFKKKLYNFFVNGSTGKVGGKTPKSILKILGVALGAVLAVVGVALFFTL